MLGITNHWASFIAIKAFDGSINFFYFDSRNRDYLEWKESDIIDFLNKEQILRNKNWSHFELLVKK